MLMWRFTARSRSEGGEEEKNFFFKRRKKKAAGESSWRDTHTPRPPQGAHGWVMKAPGPLHMPLYIRWKGKALQWEALIERRKTWKLKAHTRVLLFFSDIHFSATGSWITFFLFIFLFHIWQKTRRFPATGMFVSGRLRCVLRPCSPVFV